MRGQRFVFADAEAAARGAAQAIAEAIGAHTSEGPFHLALSGGKTPRRTYELLAERPLPWGVLHVWFGDERCVAPDDAESNYAMARAALFDRVQFPAGSIHRIRGELADREEAAREYEKELPRRFDLMLFGLGADGHTASLFPGSPALEEKTCRVLPVVGPKPPANRITVTPPVLAAARRLMVLATGAEKAVAVRVALAEEVEATVCPARLLRDAEWYLDVPAFMEAGGRVTAVVSRESPPPQSGSSGSPLSALRPMMRDPP
jgi:6-phosphogluconolactonase